MYRPNQTVLINTALLTAYGSYEYKRATVEEVKALLQTGFTSYIGHKATAQVLSEDLGVVIAFHRGGFQQQPGDTAIVVKIHTPRLQEGALLDESEIRRIGYDFGILLRLA